MQLSSIYLCRFVLSSLPVMKVDTKIGILGGGQLGRMFIQNAINYGIEVNILDEDSSGPCASICTEYIQGSLYDEPSIRNLASCSDILTYEIEHVNTEVLLQLEKEGMPIFPKPSVLQIIQNKGLQKQFYTKNNIPTAPYIITHFDEICRGRGISHLLLQQEKVVVKALTGGYDGKGVSIINTAELKAGNIPFVGEWLIEQHINCKKELSVIVSVFHDDTIVHYPPVEMYFCPDANLVTYLFSPAQVSDELSTTVTTIACSAVAALNSPGLYAVELFLDEDDNVFVNEIAPRPHNSGHHTIEGFYSSQYDQFLRILLRLPPGSTDMKHPCAMINLVGEHEGAYTLAHEEEILSIEGVFLHLYGKKMSKKGRKLGHITIVKPTVDALHTTVALLLAKAKIIPA